MVEVVNMNAIIVVDVAGAEGVDGVVMDGVVVRGEEDGEGEVECRRFLGQLNV